ncbi:hypothetical protein [Lentiprolixibacter aurantiacus]|uniref:Lipoprotein n=1 Tax=Lentiprolixibacter aurantiacus TaxID=2993939 RepID=A0AAE3SMS4_9FLAO|nr:hypothetical protein [Lentiprolixibacter aurantiacus]MCX2718606.1 hypothetical protein [Lentiprolixibacter aurantiacus]
MKQLYVWIGLFLLLGLSACDLEDDGIKYHFVPLQITSVDVPDSFTLNETYEISATFIRPSNCVFFEGFDVRQLDTTVRNVVVIGSEIDNRECTQVVEEVTETFNFLVIYDQTYVFRFWTGEDENGESQYLEVTVPVN